MSTQSDQLVLKLFEQVKAKKREIEAINKARIAGKSDDDIKLLVIKLEALRGVN